MSRYTTISKMVFYLVGHRYTTLHALLHQAYMEIYPSIHLEALERKVLQALDLYAQGLRFDRELENWIEAEYYIDD